MALVAYNTFFPEIAAHVPGCPDPVMEYYIRKVCIELCTKGKVWRAPLTDVTLVDGTYAYTLSSPIAGTEVFSILYNKLHLATSGADVVLQMVTEEQLRRAYPKWPDDTARGEPVALFQRAYTGINLCPVPDDADTYTLSLIAAIRPTKASTTVEESVLYDNTSAIFHGVLYELMLMPERSWTSEKTALIHGKHWAHELAAAKARANKGFGGADVTIQMRPWA